MVATDFQFAASWTVDDPTRVTFVLQVAKVEVILHVEGIHLTEMCRYVPQFLNSYLFIDLLLLLLWHLPNVHIHILFL